MISLKNLYWDTLFPTLPDAFVLELINQLSFCRFVRSKMELMIEKILLGIDPGFSGALSLIKVTTEDIDTQYYKLIKLIEILPMPLMKNKRAIYSHSIIDFLNRYHLMNGIDLAVIEDVSAMPGQGVTGMFRFGYGTGLIQGILDAMSIRTIKIKPAVWKSALGIGREKREAIACANAFFPHRKCPHFNPKQDGEAEASLIAYFGATRLLRFTQ